MDLTGPFRRVPPSFRCRSCRPTLGGPLSGWDAHGLAWRKDEDQLGVARRSISGMSINPYESPRGIEDRRRLAYGRLALFMVVNGGVSYLIGRAAVTGYEYGGFVLSAIVFSLAGVSYYVGAVYG